MLPPLALVLLALGAVTLLTVALARSFVIAQPDEWLLCIRNGRLVQAGIGISLWRLPGDVVARFTSTMQRVGFSVGALSKERLRVSIEGFVLWSVSADGDGPFRAFRKLGLVNLDAPPGDLKSPRHLLSTAQHRAFQQLLGAAVQRLVSARSLDDLLLRQDAVVAELREQLAVLEPEMGVRVDQVEVLQIRPADEELLRQMSAEVEERVREEAANAHLETAERTQRRALESEARLAQEHADARSQTLQREKALRLAQLGHEREIRLREQEVEREQALGDEAKTIEVARAVVAREELQLAARLDRVRREAAASGDAIAVVASAEETKSQGVRDHELARLVAEKVGDALKALPLREARWITVGPESPVSSLAALFAAARDLTSTARRGPPR
jgi:regulator of protease activity HflC (stomatin/prohibitin superfamily)